MVAHVYDVTYGIINNDKDTLVVIDDSIVRGTTLKRSIIRMLKGNEDAIQAKQKAWLNWRKRFGPQTYDEFSQDFNAAFDPRTFQFKYMTPKERQDYIDRMDPRDRGQFVQALTTAHKRGWITTEGQ